MVRVGRWVVSIGPGLDMDRMGLRWVDSIGPGLDGPYGAQVSSWYCS